VYYVGVSVTLGKQQIFFGGGAAMRLSLSVLQQRVLVLLLLLTIYVCTGSVCGVQMQIASLLELTGLKADARHLESVTQQLSQATGEMQVLTNQLQTSQSETVSCFVCLWNRSCYELHAIRYICP